MPNPVIAPAPWVPGAVFTVTDSPWAALDLALAEPDEETVQVILTVPAGATVAALRDPAGWAGAGAPLLAAGAWVAGPVALGTWTLTVTPGAAATDPATLSVSTAASGAGRLRLVCAGLAGPLSAEVGAGDASLDRVLAAPTILNAQVLSVLPIREHDGVTLSAAVSATQVENPTPTLPLPPLPALVTAWSADPSNTIALPGFQGAGTMATFSAPAVYADTPVSFTVRGALDLAGNGVLDASDPATSAALATQVTHVRYGMALVLDRSGSMSSTLGGGQTKWDAAVRAAHAWCDLFRAFRPGGQHVAGIITFDHDPCGWSQTPPNQITFRNPADGSPVTGPGGMTPLSGLGNVNDWNLGTDQNCTPIGDGLALAWQAMATHLVGGDRGAVILITDGYENAGLTSIAAAAPAAAVKTFAFRRAVDPGLPGSGDLATGNAFIGGVAADNFSTSRVYTLALGTSVDEDRLDDLGSAIYRQVAQDLSEVTPAFAEMLGHALSAEQAMPQAPMQPDPEAPPNALYFHIPAGDSVLAFLVTGHVPPPPTAPVPWSIADQLRIAHRPQGSTAAFTVLVPGPAVTETRRGGHGLTRVDLRTQFGNAPPATEWRLQHMAGGVAQPSLAARSVVMEDLTTAVDVGFEGTRHYAGEPLRLEARIATGGLPVTDATVLVDVARPGEGLGTYLAQNGPRYVKLGDDLPKPRGGDPDKGKGLMFRTLLQMDEIEALPILQAADLALAADPAAPGRFAGAFPDTAKEGTYTVRFRVEGRLPDGSRFGRVFVRSVWLGVRPDPRFLSPVWASLAMQGDLRVSLLTITPRSAGGEFLGPWRGDQIVPTVHGGRLDGRLVDNLDGSYGLRVIHLDPTRDPVVTLDVGGVAMPPTGPATAGPLGGTPTCAELWWRAILCTVRSLFGRKPKP